MFSLKTPLHQTISSRQAFVPQKRQFIKSVMSTLAAMIVIVLMFSSCNQSESPIHGTYRIYSDDPMVRMFITGQDTYIRIQDDGKIVYNTTINQKPKFHNEGTYILDEKTNTLDIKWSNGKMPNKLTIQKVQEDYVIRVGETIYKKEKAAG